MFSRSFGRFVRGAARRRPFAMACGTMVTGLSGWTYTQQNGKLFLRVPDQDATVIEFPPSAPAGGPSLPTESGIHVICPINVGHRGNLWLASQACDGEPTKQRLVVLKMAPYETEQELLPELSHEGVVKCHGNLITTDGHPVLVMEYCLGTLKEYLRQSNNMSQWERTHLALQIAKSVEYLESKKVVHNDLNPSNILLTQCEDVKQSSGAPIIRVGDFGLATQGNHKLFTEARSLKVSPDEYAAPETKIASRNSVPSFLAYKRDIYSLGIILEQNLFPQTEEVFVERSFNVKWMIRAATCGVPMLRPSAKRMVKALSQDLDMSK